MTRQPTRVAIITSIIAPYRIPVFNALAAFDDIDLTVYFLSATRTGRDWKVYIDEIRFRYHAFRERRISSHRPDIRASIKLLSSLQNGNYDVVVWSGYTYLASWIGMLLAHLSGKASILWSESNYLDKDRHSVTEFLKSMIIRTFGRYLAAGRSSREYLIRLGAAPEQVYVAPDAVDVDFWGRKSLAFRENALALKAQHGLPDRIILFVGRLVWEKGLPTLLEAFRRLKSKDVGLVVVGDGPKRAEYERTCRDEGNERVLFVGFQHREQLPFFYGIADLFVLPSLSEPWGLVINEAMSCRLPIIASSAAGATSDLVLDGVNGYRFDPGDVSQLASLMDRLLQDDAKRHQMGCKSWEIIQFYTPERCALGFAQAIRGEPNTAGRWSLMSDDDRRHMLTSPSLDEEADGNPEN